MKKILTILLVVCMVAALSVSAFAYNISSPTATASTAQGTVKELDASSEAAQDWTSVSSVKAFVEAQGLEEKIANSETLTLSNVFDFTPDESVQAGDTVTFKDSAIKAGKRVVVLHFNNSAWEVVFDGTADANGEVSFTYESASPYAILVEQSGNVKSDKTGDMPYELFLLGGMMLFGTVALVASKRREN